MILKLSILTFDDFMPNFDPEKKISAKNKQKTYVFKQPLFLTIVSFLFLG